MITRTWEITTEIVYVASTFYSYITVIGLVKINGNKARLQPKPGV